MDSDVGDPTKPEDPVSAERLSPDVVRALYEVHGADLLAFLAGILRNPDAAQDACQATFQRLLESGHLARADTIRGWLFKVAFHEAMALQRKETRQARFERDYEAQAGGNPAEPGLSLQSLVRAEEVVRLKQALMELPLEQQLVIRRRIHDDKTFAVIADELNVPLGTVLTRMRLAMQKLQKWFGREG